MAGTTKLLVELLEHVEDAERDEADAKAVSGTYGLDLDMDGPVIVCGFKLVF